VSVLVWHRFGHSLSWANDITQDITVSQSLLRYTKPEMTAVYTHGNFDKALEAPRKHMEQLVATKPALKSTQ
jgi:hypothetical protein